MLAIMIATLARPNSPFRQTILNFRTRTVREPELLKPRRIDDSAAGRKIRLGKIKAFREAGRVFTRVECLRSLLGLKVGIRNEAVDQG